MLFYTGIRAGKLLSLNLQRDISLENNTITINHTMLCSIKDNGNFFGFYDVAFGY